MCAWSWNQVTSSMVVRSYKCCVVECVVQAFYFWHESCLIIEAGNWSSVMHTRCEKNSSLTKSKPAFNLCTTAQFFNSWGWWWFCKIIFDQYLSKCYKRGFLKVNVDFLFRAFGQESVYYIAKRNFFKRGKCWFNGLDFNYKNIMARCVYSKQDKAKQLIKRQNCVDQWLGKNHCDREPVLSHANRKQSVFNFWKSWKFSLSKH